jgi:hypothetical protein
MSTTSADLLDALQHLTSDELRIRIHELEAQADGLRRLLISVAARERAAARKAKLRAESAQLHAEKSEACHA